MDESIPVIDVNSLVHGGDARSVAEAIGGACRQHGFFYVVGHGVEQKLQRRLESLSREFFAWPLEDKLDIEMKHGGRAWRGYFPVGAELTSGLPDQKEGLYFGQELPGDHPKVKAGAPLHGRNLFPDLPGFREATLEYIDALTKLGHRVLEGVALSLGLNREYFYERYTADPLILFRIFHYPPLAQAEDHWSVGEHTDYGLLTILRQDENGGLQVKSGDRWIDAPPVENAFVCNLGDMLDRLTGGLYRSTLHRVRNAGASGRLSFPLFFDPNFDAELHPIHTAGAVADDAQQRWDQVSVRNLQGNYGDYLLAKVAKVFPDLAANDPAPSDDRRSIE